MLRLEDSAVSSKVEPAGIGVLTACFAGYSAWWVLDELPYESSARSRAKSALGLSVFAVILQVIVVLYAIDVARGA